MITCPICGETYLTCTHASREMLEFICRGFDVCYCSVEGERRLISLCMLCRDSTESNVEILEPSIEPCHNCGENTGKGKRPETSIFGRR